MTPWWLCLETTSAWSCMRCSTTSGPSTSQTSSSSSPWRSWPTAMVGRLRPQPPSWLAQCRLLVSTPPPISLFSSLSLACLLVISTGLSPLLRFALCVSASRFGLCSCHPISSKSLSSLLLRLRSSLSSYLPLSSDFLPLSFPFRSSHKQVLSSVQAWWGFWATAMNKTCVGPALRKSQKQENK